MESRATKVDHLTRLGAAYIEQAVKVRENLPSRWHWRERREAKHWRRELLERAENILAEAKRI